MAIETINKILSPTNATYINGVSAERRFSTAVLTNMYQGLVEKGGKGIDDKFVKEDDATHSAQVFVNRILPIKMKPREQGANRNGGSFADTKHYVQTETVGIDILMVLDDPFIIARARQDMIPTDLLAEETRIYSDRLKTIVNGATFGCKWLSVYGAKAKDEDINEVVIGAEDKVLDKFVAGNSLLDEGDDAHGVDIFPEDTRIAVFKPSYRAILKTSGVLVLGGANYGYDIARKGGLDAEAEPRKVEDGFIGSIDGVDCHIISNESLQHASEFCGFPAGEFKNTDVIGYISSSYANARGVSTAEQIKIVDAIGGQGLEVQPYTKFGVASWYPKGNVALVKASYNPIGLLKTIFPAPTYDIEYKLKPAGSRLFPSVPATAWSALTNSAFTLSGVTAKDDFDVEHLEGAYYVVGDVAYTYVNDFLKATQVSGAETGSFTVGTSKSFTATISANKIVTCLLIADDGSCVLTSKKYTA